MKVPKGGKPPYISRLTNEFGDQAANNLRFLVSANLNPERAAFVRLKIKYVGSVEGLNLFGPERARTKAGEVRLGTLFLKYRIAERELLIHDPRILDAFIPLLKRQNTLSIEASVERVVRNVPALTLPETGIQNDAEFLEVRAQQDMLMSLVKSLQNEDRFYRALRRTSPTRDAQIAALLGRIEAAERLQHEFRLGGRCAALFE